MWCSTTFSEVGQNETERVVGGFNHYNDVLVGDVQFLSNNIAVAVGENVISIYKIKEYPSLEKEIQIDNTIDRVFFGTDYIGLVLDNSDSGELYKSGCIQFLLVQRCVKLNSEHRLIIYSLMVQV